MACLGNSGRGAAHEDRERRHLLPRHADDRRHRRRQPGHGAGAGARRAASPGWGECEASPAADDRRAGDASVALRLPRRPRLGAGGADRRHRRTSQASPGWSPSAASTCCRPRTPGRASRSPCGTCSARRAPSRPGRCSGRLASRPEAALRLAALRRRPARDLAPGARGGCGAATGRPSSAGARTGAAASPTMPTR